ncbi:hypothetical protein ACFVVX_23950 [Kitasatospora sp. NPDC058170]|uniref:hypothetical protein n=1 Tax=Kitasatospora sp. NPDC058170 TaxID=3346364 RepID=UPI0036DCC297
MICPHCQSNLRQRERTGRTCSNCRKKFALDPKLDGTGLHDVRIRRTTTRLTDEGRLVCTVDQVRWALEHRGRPAQEFRGSKGGAGCLTVFGIGALIAAMALPGGLMVAAALVGVALIGFAVRAMVLSDVPAPPRPRQPLRAADSFRSTLVTRWKEVYGSLPAGLVEDDRVKSESPVGSPAVVLLCPDRTVTRFLQANGFPREHRALLVTDLRSVPDGVPVAVLHDASPQGCLLVADARAKQSGRRVVDAGLPAHAVLAAESRFVHLRDPARPEELQIRLERSVPGLSPSELAWYAEGWWSPLAALPPKRLLAIAVRAVERAAEPPARIPLVKQRRPEDPTETRRRALAVGFLTWPEEGTA